MTITNQGESQIAKIVGQIKGVIDEVSANPQDYDTSKVAVELYELVLQSMRVCPSCGIDRAVEAEVFRGDKLFKRHNCQG